MRNIAENIFSLEGITAFARAIGFTDKPSVLPRTNGLTVTHLGQRGSLRCVHAGLADCDVANLTRVARHLRNHFGGELLLFIFSPPDCSRVCVACFNIDELCRVSLERGRIHQSDVDALTELVPQNGEAGLQLALRHIRA
ncbi:MAG TPA: hypothetical protein VGC44_13245, partial [Longimicrobiales bacterium]